MARLQAPTILLVSGPIAQDAVTRLQDALPPGDPLLRVIDLREGWGATFLNAATSLLRVASGDGGPRLDLFALLDQHDAAGPRPREVCQTVGAALAEGLRSVFDPRLPPEQRSVGLHLLLPCRPLVPNAGTAEVLQRVAEAEAWQQHDPVHPVLSRIWLLPTQTQAGQLGDDDVAAAAATFLQATIAAGLRDDPAVRARLDHLPTGTGIVASLAAARLHTPIARVERYARLRAAHDAIDTLIRRVQRQAEDATSADAGLGRLDAEALVAPFRDGEPATQLRNLAWRLSGGAQIAEHVAILPFDTETTLQERYAPLFRAATGGEAQTIHSASEQEALQAALQRLDAAEASTLHAVDGALRGQLEGDLGSGRRLSRLPEARLALTRLRARLIDDARSDAVPDGAPLEGEAADPARQALFDAVEALPGTYTLLASACLGAFATSMIALAGTTAWLDAPPAASGAGGLSGAQVVSTAPAAPAPPSILLGIVPWAMALLVFGLVTWGLTRWLGAQTRRPVGVALSARRDALLALKASGRATALGREAGVRLRLHRLRVRDGAIRACDAALDRLDLLSATLHDQRDALRHRLDALGVRPGPRAADDDLTHLIGTAGRMHAPLLEPHHLRDLALSGRQYVDADAWADALLAATWPTNGGLTQDLPCADLDAVVAAASAQSEGMYERSPLDAPATAQHAADRVAERLPSMLRALRPGLQATDIHGDRILGLRDATVLCIAPMHARTHLTDALAASGLRADEAHWGNLAAPAVLILRTFEGYRAEQVARGAGVEFTG